MMIPMVAMTPNWPARARWRNPLTRSLKFPVFILQSFRCGAASAACTDRATAIPRPGSRLRKGRRRIARLQRAGDFQNAVRQFRQRTCLAGLESILKVLQPGKYVRAFRAAGNLFGQHGCKRYELFQGRIVRKSKRHPEQSRQNLMQNAPARTVAKAGFIWLGLHKTRHVHARKSKPPPSPGPVRSAPVPCKESEKGADNRYDSSDNPTVKGGICAFWLLKTILP